MSERAYQDAITELKNDHFETKLYRDRVDAQEEGAPKLPAPRPVKKHKRGVDEKGFQYICKEGSPPLYSQGFTNDELAALKSQSDEHVDHLKNGLKEYIFTINYPGDAATTHKKMRIDALEYYDKEDKRPRPAFQKDVLWTMYKHPDHTDKRWSEYIAERL